MITREMLDKIERMSLEELYKRHKLLASTVGTPDVEDEFFAVHEEIMARTSDCGTV